MDFCIYAGDFYHWLDLNSNIMKYKRQLSNGILYWIILIIIIWWLNSCTKQSIEKPANYTMIIDQLSLDTSTLFKRYTQDLGILKLQDAARIDTTKDQWYIDCNLLNRLQHLYYLRNGIKIQN